MDLLRNIDIGTIAIQFAVLLFSLSIHEASHAWMADRLGDSTARYLGRVTLNPLPHIDPIGTILLPLMMLLYPNGLAHRIMIGWAKPVPIQSTNLRNPRRDHILISVVGPASNLLAAIVSFGILCVVNPFSTEVQALAGRASILTPIVMIVISLMRINLVLAVFNLLPIPPLDGHWILYEILPRSAESILARATPFGFIIIIGLMYFGVFNIILSPIVGLFVGILVRIAR